MDLGITGKKALVLASSKGLGKGVALELSKEGVEVMICGRNLNDLQDTAKEINNIGSGTVYYTVGDITTESGRTNILSACREHLHKVDILVTNTGGPPPGKFEDLELSQWSDSFKLLIESAVGIIRGVLPDMKKQEWGRIITITSQSIKQPVDGLILSNAVRSAMLGLVKTLSNELGPYNITVNNILPGYTRTDRLNNLIKANPQFGEAIKDIPLGRIGEVEEFAKTAVFLSSQCASYITGVSLPVDGGWIKGV